MAVHASRDTTTGLAFEQQVQIHREDGLDISKTKLKIKIDNRVQIVAITIEPFIALPCFLFRIPTSNFPSSLIIFTSVLAFLVLK